MASLNTLISVAHAGGQGKTTVAQLLYIAAQRVGANYKIAAADNMDENGKSKIGKLYGDKVEEYGTGALLTAARTENNPNASLRYWDKFGHVLLSGGYVVDLGANVISRLLEWAEDRRVESLLERRNARTSTSSSFAGPRSTRWTTCSRWCAPSPRARRSRPSASSWC